MIHLRKNRPHRAWQETVAKEFFSRPYTPIEHLGGPDLTNLRARPVCRRFRMRLLSQNETPMRKTTRILEPEVMDTMEAAITYDQMNHHEVNCRFVDDLLQPPVPEGEFLDLGTGTGLIPLELCRRNDRFRVLAVDLAVSMLDLARIHTEIAGLTQQIHFDRADAKHLPYETSRFALVMSNSILHHLPEPVLAIREAVRVTMPLGRLFFRDLLRPDTAAEIDSLVNVYAGGESDHARQLFRESLQAALNLDEIRTLVASCGFPEASVIQSSDRHWTWDVPRSEGLSP